MSTRINPKVERALREAMGHVAQAEDDQIEPSLAVLDDGERAEALGLSVAITCYVALDVCETWPSDADARRVAKGLATVGTTAEGSHLDADEIYAYLSRAVFGMEPVGDVIPDEASATRLMITVAQRAAVAYCPVDMSTWEYLDVIEGAIDAASELDPAVIPAAVMRAYYQADRDNSAELVDAAGVITACSDWGVGANGPVRLGQLRHRPSWLGPTAGPRQGLPGARRRIGGGVRVTAWLLCYSP